MRCLHVRVTTQVFRTTAAATSLLAAAGCQRTPLDGTTGGGGPGDPSPMQQVLYDGGVARDGIPSLVNPGLVNGSAPGAAYLEEYATAAAHVPELPELRVIGMEIEGEAIPVPHNILWWHEIANIDIGGRRLAVTYCPLTASALVFDASRVPTDRFGVSGLVFKNNLVMFDPETESLWPQMMLEARCGRRVGARLDPVPHVEMSWERWMELHPDTRVVSSDLGLSRDYAVYPYDLYEAADEFLLFPMPGGTDKRRRAKERVLGVRDGAGGMAFPFEELEALGERAAIEVRIGARDVLVLWDGSGRAAQAYEPRTVSGRATLRVDGAQVSDVETGSVWTVEGRAIAGSREGERLIAVADAFVAFWFAWASFYPETRLWTP